MDRGANNSMSHHYESSGNTSHFKGLGFVLALGVALLAAGVGGYYAHDRFGAAPLQISAASTLPSGSQAPTTNAASQAPITNTTPNQSTAPQSSTSSQTQTAQSTGQADYQAYCLRCHRSVTRLQKFSANEIIGVTSYGKGRMPGFAQSLGQDRIQAIADFIVGY